MKLSSKIYTTLIFVFLFAPIAVLLIFSFNETKSLSVFSGFSFKWYKELMSDRNTLESVKNTVILAFTATAISTVMGTAAAFGVYRAKKEYTRAIFNTVTNIPMINPDIITGISMMLVFVFAGRLFGMSTSLSFWTILIAHVTFCLPYVIFQVLPKLQQMDYSLVEAAQDLGCTPVRAFFKVTLPEIMPGIINGLLLSFTMSIDDFIISFFTTGNGVSNLSIYVYSMARRGLNPKINALSTIMFVVVIIMLFIINKRSSKDKSKNVLFS